MEEKISLLGIDMDCLNVGQAMQRIKGFLKNDQLNTVAILTADSLLTEESRQQLQQYDLRLPGEQCLLKTTGISGGEISQELERHELYNRLFWYLIRSGMRFLLAGGDTEETEALHRYLREEYTEIDIVGEESGFSSEKEAEDSILNRINGLFPDVILSGLDSPLPEAFLQRNKRKLNGRIWISLGRDPFIRQEAGCRENLFQKSFRNLTFRRTVARYSSE